MTAAIHLISSMATKKLLAELIEHYRGVAPQEVLLEAVGGVDAAKRVAAGEVFDGVALAAKTIDELIASGRIVAGSRVDLVTSGVAVAVRAGASQPGIGTEEAVKQAVLAARTISYSTGPSGVHLAKLFERWGMAEVLKGRIVQAPPGVPVGSLVANGVVELGFQQYSELMDVPGITVLGPLPDAIQIITTFSAGVAASSTQPDAVRALLAFLSSPAVAAIKRRQGMEPA